jgi:Type IV pili methyl-accepting chemotaxis transducer N-term
MITTRRSVLKVISMALLAPAAHTSIAQISTATAINRAGRFRALSQRCAKAYCQLQQEVMPDNAKDVMASAQRLIQVGFEDLGRAGLAGENSKWLAAVQADANALNGMLGLPPTKAGIVTLSLQADKMLASANALTSALEGSSKQSSAKLINIAGRQRMLSQRLAKNYFLATAGAESKLTREQLVEDRAEFKQNMATLGAAPISTTSIRNELQLAQTQWVFFEGALGRKVDMDSMRNIATTSERLLEVNNNLAAFYEAALKDILGATS